MIGFQSQVLANTETIGATKTLPKINKFTETHSYGTLNKERLCTAGRCYGSQYEDYTAVKVKIEEKKEVKDLEVNFSSQTLN